MLVALSYDRHPVVVIAMLKLELVGVNAAVSLYPGVVTPWLVLRRLRLEDEVSVESSVVSTTKLRLERQN